MKELIEKIDTIVNEKPMFSLSDWRNQNADKLERIENLLRHYKEKTKGIR